MVVLVLAPATVGFEAKVVAADGQVLWEGITMRSSDR